MQVLINGRPEPAFDVRKERKLTITGEREFAEGKVMSEDDMIGGFQRRMKILYGVLGAFCVVVFIGLPFADLSEASIIVPVDVVLAVSLGFYMRFTYRRSFAKERAAVGPRLKRMAAPPGATVRADPAGLTVGGHVTRWSDLTIDTLEVIRVSTTEGGDVRYIGALVMTAGGSPIVLDSTAITDGRMIVDYAWRRLRGH
jgi:hypothetical protein